MIPENKMNSEVTSKDKHAAGAVSKVNRDKRVVIYCRESRDDNGTHYERIETQRDLLLRFCERKGYSNIVEILLQDDFSGTDFRRLDELKKKIQLGEVDVLVMKDSSRLGRNQLESLKFVQFLEDYGVKLEFEGRGFDEEFFPLEAWFNERRARDDSVKIRTSLRHRMEEGKLLIHPIYGYRKTGNRLVPDEVTAGVVREIFEMYLKGYGYRTIANLLNKREIPTPGGKVTAGEFLGLYSGWQAQDIGRILKNENYTGWRVSGTTRKASFKSKKILRTASEEWVRVENSHPPIISRDEYEQVQQQIDQKRRFAPKSRTNLEPSLFSGFLYCGRCGSRLICIRTGRNKSPRYQCQKYHREGREKENSPDKGCSSHRISEKDLLTLLNHLLRIYLDQPGKKEQILFGMAAQENTRQSQEIRLSRLRVSLETWKKHLLEVYQDKLDRKITDFVYQEKSVELEKKIQALEKQLSKLNEERQLFQGENKTALLQDLTAEGIALDREGIRLLLDRILVFESGELTEILAAKLGLNPELCTDQIRKGGVVLLPRIHLPIGEYILADKIVFPQAGTTGWLT